LGTTGHNKLYYIGHSMGTTVFFVMLSQRPEYNEKIRAMVAFAPAAFFTPSKHPLLHYVQTVAERFLEVTSAIRKQGITQANWGKYV
jgi:pimeloyl-ACP methyl ester carboxylesterase